MSQALGLRHLRLSSAHQQHEADGFCKNGVKQARTPTGEACRITLVVSLMLCTIIFSSAETLVAQSDEIDELRRAADQGHAKAQNLLGMAYDNGYEVPQDDAQAAEWYRRAADQGHADAQTNLGFMYAKGEGVPQDYAQALVWYRLAADQGFALAQTNLGTAYAKGEGVPQDYAQAFAWFRRAADQGDGVAQYSLGVMYVNGHGVPQDYVTAHTFYNLAGANGYEDARKARDNLAAMMTAEQIAEAQRRAREWKPATSQATSPK